MTSQHTYRVQDAVVAGRDGDIPVREYLPATETGAPFVWMHGGGFAFGGLDMKESDAPARFIAATGRRVRAVDYRLAPKIGPWTKPDLRHKPGRFPEAMHDVVDAAADLASVTGRRIAIGGASAGANLAAAAALMIRDEGHLEPFALVLPYGAFHSVLPENDQIEGELRGLAGRIMFTPAMTERIFLNYVGDRALIATPGYSAPAGSDLHGLPPTILINADNDRLRRSGHAFADELRAAGVEVREETVHGAHGFLNSPKKAGFAERMGWIVDWLDAHEPR
jgi:acetyl esterase